MTDEIVKSLSRKARVTARELLNKQDVEDPGKANAKRERFLIFLKKRYGYTNEKAVDELERLLRQFYKTNRSLGIHRTQADIKHLYE